MVLANGADPVVPPVPGLKELDGVWTSREATSMKAVPRRLLIMGGGPVGVEMAQVVRRLGGEVVVIDKAEHVLAREPAPLGEALGRGPERATASSSPCPSGSPRPGATATTSSWSSTTGGSCAATGCWSPPDGDRGSRVSASSPWASRPTPHGVPVDARLRVADGLWAIGDVTGLWPLTHVGKYQGEVVAANILGGSREANYEAVPRVTYTDPQAAAVGEAEGRFSGTAKLSEVAKTATYTHAYAENNGYLTLVSDGQRLTGAHGLGPEAGEWMQQATLAIRAHVPLDVLGDTIQPFPTFSEIYVGALKSLRDEVARGPRTGRRDGDARDHRRVGGVGGVAGADRRRDRRQRRDRAGDGQARAGGGRRRDPDRSDPRPAGESLRPRSVRAAPPPSTRTTSTALEGFFAGLDGADRPRDGDGREAVLLAAVRDGLRRGASRASTSTRW